MKASFIIFVSSLTFSFQAVFSEIVISAVQQKAITPREALQRLQAGNKRFVKGSLEKQDYKAVRKYNAQGQYPFAFIFNCVDSRSVPELLFDQVPGNIFVGRILVNVLNASRLIA